MNNWYTIFKEAFRNKYDIAAQKLTKIIFKKFKEDKIDDYVFGPSSVLSWDLDIDYVDVHYFKNKNLPEPFNVSGRFHFITPPREKGIGLTDEDYLKIIKSAPATLNIVIEINPETFDKKHYRDIYLEILGAVRHEIEHGVSRKYRDYIEKGPDISREENFFNHVESVLRYLKDRSEIESFARQFFLISKKKGKGKDNFVDPAKLIRDKAIKYLGISDYNKEYQEQILDLNMPDGEKIGKKINDLEEMYSDLISKIREGGRTWK